jgi:hypothetical protein
MPARTNSLTTTKLQDLLTYEQEETTKELYGLGSMLLAECVDRAKQLDARAIALSVYSGVTAALLVSVFSPRMSTMTWWPAAFIVAAGVSLFVATVLAFSALWIREYEWFSDKDWFQTSLLEDPDYLKRAHILAMHQYRARHEQVNSRKARILMVAYCSLVACGGMLVAGLVATRF